LKHDKKHNLPIMGDYTTLPRMKSIPKISTLSKWEKFKFDKKINSKTKSRLIYDEVTKEWVPRYGYNSLKNRSERREAIIEYNDGNVPNILKRKRSAITKNDKLVKENIPDHDPFEKKRINKNETIKKEDKKHLNNLHKKEKEERNNSRDKIDESLYMKDKKKHNQEEIKGALKNAQQSTQSVGKYDKRYKEEKELQKIKKR